MNKINKLDLSRIKAPIIFEQTRQFSYRDPAAYYKDGTFYLYFTLVEQEGAVQYFYVAMSKSTDLIHWSEPIKLTLRDKSKEYSSPGNILKFKGKYYLCIQTYCRENGEVYGNEKSRIFVMETTDLEHFEEPRLLKVKGEDVNEEDMGRMIDPYLLEDKDEKGKIWCFYKQNGLSYSYSYDLLNWTYVGNIDCGENLCVVVKDDEYVIFHSPENGIGTKTTKDFVNFEDKGVTYLDQEHCSWAKDRITAGFVLDCTENKEIGAYIMFYHGDKNEEYVFGASLAIAVSYDLEHWNTYSKDKPTFGEFGVIYPGDYYNALPFNAYIDFKQSLPKGENVYDIRDFGAIADGQTLNTEAFQAAAECCRKVGGGTVLVEGGHYCMGPVYLYSNTVLHIAPDSALVASKDLSRYSSSELLGTGKSEGRFDNAFVHAIDADKVTITGGGKIIGSGEYFVYPPHEKPLLTPMGTTKLQPMFSHVMGYPEDTIRYAYRSRIRYAEDRYGEGLPRIKRPGYMVMFKRCTNVKLQNIILEDAMAWTLNLFACDGVEIEDFVINDNRHVANSDGIDVTGSSNVKIKHCFVSCADDGIVIKNPIDTEVELMSDIHIQDCTISSVMNAFKIGTETYGDIGKVLVENCRFTLPDIYPGSVSGISIESSDGSNVYDITIRNIEMEQVTCPIFICLNMRNRYNVGSVNDLDSKYYGGSIKGITIENVNAIDMEVPCILSGFEVNTQKGIFEKKIEDIVISNFNAIYRDNKEDLSIPDSIPEYLTGYPENNNFGDVDAYGLWVRHGENVYIKNCNIIPRTVNTRDCIKTIQVD